MTDAEQSYQTGHITLEEGLALQANRPELASLLPALDTYVKFCECDMGHGIAVHLLMPAEVESNRIDALTNLSLN